MKLHLSRRLVGFTLIELMVVVAILAALAAISAPMITSRMNAGDIAKCRSNVEQLSLMGIKYSQDMAHSHLLPVSGMADDEDTENINESDGWWLSLAQEMKEVVLPQSPKGLMKVSEIFHCPSDKRLPDSSTKSVETSLGMMVAHPSTISYVSWTDGSEDPENPSSCIRTTAKQRLDELPWISDGIPVAGESVTDPASFGKLVRPAFERHNGSIVVAYAGGSVRTVEVDPDESNEKLFRLFAPELASKAAKTTKGKKGKKGKGKKARRAAEDDED